MIELLISTVYGIGSGLVVGLAGYIKNDSKTKGFFNTMPSWKKALPIMLSCAVVGAVAGFYGVTPAIATTMPVTLSVGLVIEQAYKSILARFKPKPAE